MPTRYKLLNLDDHGRMWSKYGNCIWHIGEWKQEPVIEICERGFHCSRSIFDAFYWVQGDILAEVECDGISEMEGSKEVWSRMRVVKVWKWSVRDSIALAIELSNIALSYYKDIHPDDDEPYKAIEAAEQWLANPTEEHKAIVAEFSHSIEGHRCTDGYAGGWVNYSVSWVAWTIGTFKYDPDSCDNYDINSAVERIIACVIRRIQRDELIEKLTPWMHKHLQSLVEYTPRGE